MAAMLTFQKVLSLLNSDKITLTREKSKITIKSQIFILGYIF